MNTAPLDIEIKNLSISDAFRRVSGTAIVKDVATFSFVSGDEDNYIELLARTNEVTDEQVDEAKDQLAELIGHLDAGAVLTMRSAVEQHANRIMRWAVVARERDFSCEGV